MDIMQPLGATSRANTLRRASAAMACLCLAFAVGLLIAVAVNLSQSHVMTLSTTQSGNGIVVHLEGGKPDPTGDIFFASATEPTGACTSTLPSGAKVRKEKLNRPNTEVIAGQTYQVQGWANTVADGDLFECPGVAASALVVGVDRSAYASSLVIGLLFAMVPMLVGACFFWFARGPFARYMDARLRS